MPPNGTEILGPSGLDLQTICRCHHFRKGSLWIGRFSLSGSVLVVWCILEVVRAFESVHGILN